MFGLGAVFLQLLGLQHSLSEPCDLSGQTFLEIQDGRLVAAPPSATHALDAMWRAVDPIYVAGDNNLSVPQLATFENIFRAAHTRYVEGSSVVFYEYVWSTTDLPPPPPSPPLPFIRIQRAGKDIRFATDLPVVRVRPNKRDLGAVEGPIEDTEAERGKILPQFTPPRVRRSERLKNGYRRS
ncbi:hypothetical protein B0H19DRAFT_1064290 [Mycena capillaripes]|nr:hypothetical protein B0H19DRAFT_1064290 [Mycena capillaripes]